MTKGLCRGEGRREGDGYIVSGYAMPPYTERKAKAGDATVIQCAILRAALKQKSTCTKVFDIIVKVLQAIALIIEYKKARQHLKTK